MHRIADDETAIDWRHRHSETISDGKHPAGRSDGNQTGAAHPAWQAVLFCMASIQTRTTYEWVSAFTLLSYRLWHSCSNKIKVFKISLFCMVLFKKFLLLRSKLRLRNANVPCRSRVSFLATISLHVLIVLISDYESNNRDIWFVSTVPMTSSVWVYHLTLSLGRRPISPSSQDDGSIHPSIYGIYIVLSILDTLVVNIIMAG